MLPLANLSTYEGMPLLPFVKVFVTRPSLEPWSPALEAAALTATITPSKRHLTKQNELTNGDIAGASDNMTSIINPTHIHYMKGKHISH